MARRLVVVGADAAGMSAAHQALRTARRHGRELQVVAVEVSTHTSYSACGLPYWVAGDVAAADDLVARTADEHRRAGIDLRLRTEAVELDTYIDTLAEALVEHGLVEFGAARHLPAPTACSGPVPVFDPPVP